MNIFGSGRLDPRQAEVRLPLDIGHRNGYRARPLRGLTGLQSFAADAPVDLVYVADFSRAEMATAEERCLYCVANTGFIAQEMYLFCASQGLATVVRGAVDRPPLAKAMGLSGHQRIINAHEAG